MLQLAARASGLKVAVTFSPDANDFTSSELPRVWTFGQNLLNDDELVATHTSWPAWRWGEPEWLDQSHAHNSPTAGNTSSDLIM